MASLQTFRRVSVQPGVNSSGRHINDQCHGWVGNVPRRRRDGGVMAEPRVYAIYWDDYFQRTHAAVRLMDRYLTEILRGQYLSRLHQYGVGRAVFAGSRVIDLDPGNPPPAALRPDYIGLQLKSWIADGRVPVRPGRNETNLLYVIFTPNKTNFGTGLSGYHDHGLYGKTEGPDNLFWAPIQEWHYRSQPPQPPTPREFVDSCSWCLGHEMVEAFTNRDGHGWVTNCDCEIGDICEATSGTSDPVDVITVKFEGWLVERYWDNENQTCYPCANGDGDRGVNHGPNPANRARGARGRAAAPRRRAPGRRAIR